MEEKSKLSRAKIQSMIMVDLVFRSPLWALLILVIYGIIMSGAIWFLMHIVKPSIDAKIKRKQQSAMVERQVINEHVSSGYEYGCSTERGN